MSRKRIRNFSIIAHIDHGKSTLADRFIEHTGAIPARKMTEQVLDTMMLERERGITIKARTIRMVYRGEDGVDYFLNLIDTPGHIDFTYEVSRSLSACEGAVLVVDASQGVEAQTLANLYMALEQDLEVIPVINKIDLPNADVEGVRAQITELLGAAPEDVLLASAKEGWGIEEIFEAIVRRVPPPKGDPDARLKALIVDSWFDSYRGSIILCRVFEGTLLPDMRIRLMLGGKEFEVDEVGVFSPAPTATERLAAGEVGYVVAGIKRVKDTKIGDTITDGARPAARPLPGFKEVRPMVFCGLYPVEGGQYELLKDALDKLSLNDASFHYDPEVSNALGFGFRCGFLGLLHMDIIKERLEREYNLTLITTSPTVRYRVVTVRGEVLMIDNPQALPPPGEIARIEEPHISATIITPDEYVGAIFKLAQEKRGIQKGMEYIDSRRVIITYELPLNEVVLDFYDRLKSSSRGYASFDYELADYREGNLVKLDILINGEPVDALSVIIHRDKAYYHGRELIKKMRRLIPRQLFEVVLQAAVGSRVIARESVKALRKNVTAKCYGGDVTRKRKLLERQKEGKKRMKQVGSVEVPEEVFMTVLKIQD